MRGLIANGAIGSGCGAKTMRQPSYLPSVDEICLEARITAADPCAVRAAVEFWLQDRETGPHRFGDDASAPGYAAFDLRSAAGALSVFLCAAGDDALRTLSLHGSDLVSALGEVPGGVALTWVRHPPGRRRAG